MINSLARKVVKTNDNLKICLWFPKLLIKSLFLWPEENTNNLYRNVAFCIMMSFYGIVLWGSFGLIEQNFTDYNNSFTAVSNFSTICQAIVKTIVIYYYFNSIKLIVDNILHKFWPSSLLGIEMEYSLKGAAHMFTIGMSMLYFSGIVFSTAFVTFPLFNPSRETPYRSKYPFDWRASPAYEILYVIHSVTNTLMVFTSVTGLDILFMAICINIAGQYQLLQKALRTFGTEEMLKLNRKMDALPNNDNMEEYPEEKKFLVRCVRHHQLLMRECMPYLIERVEWGVLLYFLIFRVFEVTSEVYQLNVSFQLGFSIVAFCLSSFLLTRKDTSMDQLINIGIYISGHLVQLFLYCAFSNELEYQMRLLPDQLFGSTWYKADFVGLKKDIIIILKKSQVTMQVTALKVFPINYSTFIQVLKLSFSVYTVLSSIAGK